MNANVAFLSDEKRPTSAAPAKPVLYVPASAVRDGAVFVALGGRAVRRPVKTSASTIQGLRVDDGLIGGEDLIVAPPLVLKDGDRIASK